MVLSFSPVFEEFVHFLHLIEEMLRELIKAGESDGKWFDRGWSGDLERI